MKPNNKKDITLDHLAGMVAEGFADIQDRMATKEELNALREEVHEGFTDIDRKLDHFLGVVRGDYDGLATRVKRLEDTVFRD